MPMFRAILQRCVRPFKLSFQTQGKERVDRKLQGLQIEHQLALQAHPRPKP